MKPQHQQGQSDCTRACVATILDLPIDDVPNFTESSSVSWVRRLREFLLPFGLTAINVSFAGEETAPPKGVICCAGGPGPRGADHHVVWRDGEVIWDPYPGGGGLVGEPEDYLLFIPFDPSKAIDGRTWEEFPETNR